MPSFQGLLDNIVAYLLIYLLEAVGAVVLTLWVKKFHDLTPPVLAILGIAIFGLIMWTTNHVVILYRWWTQPAVIRTITGDTPNGEIADTIREWLDHFHLQVQKKDLGEASFSFVVRGQNDIPIMVMRLGKEREQFITFLSRVSIGAEDQVKLKSFSDQQRKRFYREITLELAKQKTNAAVEISQITIETRIPLAELTEAKFLDRIDEVSYAVNMIVVKIRLMLDL